MFPEFPILGSVGVGLTGIGTFLAGFSDIFSGLAYFTGEDFAEALARGFMG